MRCFVRRHVAMRQVWNGMLVSILVTRQVGMTGGRVAEASHPGINDQLGCLFEPAWPSEHSGNSPS
eukprot:6743413-Karenia_brevis.AAC.1